MTIRFERAHVYDFWVPGAGADKRGTVTIIHDDDESVVNLRIHDHDDSKTRHILVTPDEMPVVIAALQNFLARNEAIHNEGDEPEEQTDA